MGAGRRPQEAQATRAIRARGGSTSIVSKSPRPQVGLITPPAGPTPSTRQLSFAIIRREEDRTEERQQLVKRLQAGNAAVREGLRLGASSASGWNPTRATSTRRCAAGWTASLVLEYTHGNQQQ